MISKCICFSCPSTATSPIPPQLKHGRHLTDKQRISKMVLHIKVNYADWDEGDEIYFKDESYTEVHKCY